MALTINNYYTRIGIHEATESKFGAQILSLSMSDIEFTNWKFVLSKLETCYTLVKKRNSLPFHLQRACSRKSMILTQWVRQY